MFQQKEDVEKRELKEFEEWILATGLRPTTAQKAVDTYLLVANGSPPPTESARHLHIWAFKLHAKYAKSDDTLPEWLTLPRPAAQPRDKVSIDDTSLKLLAEAVWADPSMEAKVIEVALNTGLRIADILRTKPADIVTALSRDDGALPIEVKGGKWATITVNSARDAWRWLSEAPEDGGLPKLVAPMGDGSPDAGRGAYKAVDRALKRIGLEVGVSDLHLHRLRRTFIVRALSGGAQIHEVQRAVLHSSPNTTSRYYNETRLDWLESAYAAAKIK